MTLTRHAVVSGEQAGMRLDTFLTHFFSSPISCTKPVEGTATGAVWPHGTESPLGARQPQRTGGLSRAAVQKLIARGLVTLNGQRVKSAVRLKSSDCIEVQWLPPREPAVEAEPLPLHILHEDEDIVLVNKPPGMVVHPAAGNLRGTLVNALLHHCPDLGGIGGVRRPGIVHRLDKDTSGVMIVAKHEQAFYELAMQFKQRRVEKEYVAWVWGRVEGQRGVIDRPIGRHRRERKRMSSLHALHPLREATTAWEAEASFCLNPRRDFTLWVTLLRLRPRTGRTHQLRVHLADQGTPVIGDRVYGGKRPRSSKLGSVGIPGLTDFPRQALHAARLRFTHPRTRAPMEVLAPWPADMLHLLGLLKGMCVGRADGEGRRS